MLITVNYGATSHKGLTFPDDYTVKMILDDVKDLFGIDNSPRFLVNGDEVNGGTIPESGNVVEFQKATGTKG